MKLLQVLQKASSPETFQDDCVAGGQADAGPAGEQRERQVDVSIYKYALGAMHRIYAPNSAHAPECTASSMSKRRIFFVFDYDISAARRLHIIIKMTPFCPKTGCYKWLRGVCSALVNHRERGQRHTFF